MAVVGIINDGQEAYMMKQKRLVPIAMMRRLKKWLRQVSPRAAYRMLRQPPSRRTVVKLLAATALVITASSMTYQPASQKVDPAVYTPLLDVIAQGESSGNYNAYYGNPANAAVRFTEMSVDEVLRWQEEYVRQGSPSSAVGRYQIVRPTLVKLVRELRLGPAAQFDASMQDRLAVALLERRGSTAYVEEKLSREQFAANLAQEWAALPRITGPNPGHSYYAGDGLNESRISVEAVYNALAMVKQ
jgi:muramidase (phage lysozyme)